MILLDPDLDLALTPPVPPAKMNPASASEAVPRNLRLPAARTLARFLALAQESVRLKGQVTVLLTSDTAIRKLNRQFRGKNKATDVLSFPAEGSFPGPAAERIVGDLAISVPTALQQAKGQGHSLSTEVKVLMLHGLLHLKGYDHETDDGLMARRERLLRGKLGLPQGLIERAGAPKPALRKKPEVHPSGAKARTDKAEVNVRAKARTLQAGTLQARPVQTGTVQSGSLDSGPVPLLGADASTARSNGKTGAKGRRP
jgi:probable rRNA maturation factor